MIRNNSSQFTNTMSINKNSWNRQDDTNVCWMNVPHSKLGKEGVADSEDPSSMGFEELTRPIPVRDWETKVKRMRIEEEDRYPEVDYRFSGEMTPKPETVPRKPWKLDEHGYDYYTSSEDDDSRPTSPEQESKDRSQIKPADIQKCAPKNTVTAQTLKHLQRELSPELKPGHVQKPHVIPASQSDRQDAFMELSFAGMKAAASHSTGSSWNKTASGIPSQPIDRCSKAPKANARIASRQNRNLNHDAPSANDQAINKILSTLQNAQTDSASSGLSGKQKPRAPRKRAAPKPTPREPKIDVVKEFMDPLSTPIPNYVVLDETMIREKIRIELEAHKISEKTFDERILKRSQEDDPKDEMKKEKDILTRMYNWICMSEEQRMAMLQTEAPQEKKIKRTESEHFALESEKKAVLEDYFVLDQNPPKEIMILIAKDQKLAYESINAFFEDARRRHGYKGFPEDKENQKVQNFMEMDGFKEMYCIN